GTSITAATPADCFVTNTYSDRDTVVIYDVVGMKQISGMMFSVSGATSTGFTLPGLDSVGFAAPATAFKVRKLPKHPSVLPNALYITNISQAANAVVRVSQYNEYK